MRRASGFLPALVLTALLVGCGGDGGSGQTGDVPDGFVRYEAKGAAFAHPRGWTVTHPTAEEAGIGPMFKNSTSPEISDIVRVRGPRRDGYTPGILLFRADVDFENDDSGRQIARGDHAIAAQQVLRYEQLERSSPKIDGALLTQNVELLETGRSGPGEPIVEKTDLLVMTSDGGAYRLLAEGPTDLFKALRLDEVSGTFALRGVS